MPCLLLRQSLSYPPIYFIQHSVVNNNPSIHVKCYSNCVTRSSGSDYTVNVRIFFCLLLYQFYIINITIPPIAVSFTQHIGPPRMWKSFSVCSSSSYLLGIIITRPTRGAGWMAANRGQYWLAMVWVSLSYSCNSLIILSVPLLLLYQTLQAYE